MPPICRGSQRLTHSVDTETGPGVYETALAYTSAVRMADNALLFKYVAKSIGMQHGIIPSFMAKPWGNLPGCSGHIHVSLRDASGKNAFAVSEEELKDGRKGAVYDELKYISETAEYFLAGILDGLTDSKTQRYSPLQTLMPCLQFFPCLCPRSTVTSAS